MAITWPAKNNYATGDVLTATNMNGIGDDLNALFDNSFYAGKNKIINGDFGIWQRGTSFSFTGTEGYTADRWIVSSGGGGTCAATQQTFTLGSAPVSGYEGKNYLQVAYSVSGTSTVGLTQKIEDVRTFAGQTVTVSFWARVTSGTFAGVGPDLVQYFGSSGSSAVVTTSSSSSVTLTTSWQRFSFQFTVPSIAGKTISGGNDALWARINLGTSGTNTFQYWGFQVEAGSTATPFQTATGTKQGELAACQRYYQVFNNSSLYGEIVGQFYSSTAARFMRPLLVSLRSSSPTITYPSGTFTNFIEEVGVANRTPTAFSTNGYSTTHIIFSATGMSGATTNSMAAFSSSATAITVSAEL